MKEVFTPPYDMNVHYDSPDDAAEGYVECGDAVEGDEFELVRLIVHSKTTYRIVKGRAVPVEIAFPKEEA